MSVLFGTASSPISSNFLLFMHSTLFVCFVFSLFLFQMRCTYIYIVSLSFSVLPDEGQHSLANKLLLPCEVLLTTLYYGQFVVLSSMACEVIYNMANLIAILS